MKGLDSMRELASRGVIIEWNDNSRRPRTKSRQSNLFEYQLCANGMLRKGEAKYI